MEGQALTAIGDLSSPEMIAACPLHYKFLDWTIGREQGSLYFQGWTLLSFFSPHSTSSSSGTSFQRS